MTARQIRRAQERREQKLARKAGASTTAEPTALTAEPASLDHSDNNDSTLDFFVPNRQPSAAHRSEIPALARVLSEAQLAANRLNAKMSTGPTSAYGKRKSSLNALKSGLTGRTVLMPSDDVADYEHHLACFKARYNPSGEQECELVQTLADAQWRLNRIPNLEVATWELGRMESAHLFPNEADPAIRSVLIDAHVLRTCFKQLNNLSLQQTRLSRFFQKHLDELLRLQNARRIRERDHSAQHASNVSAAQPSTQPTTRPRTSTAHASEIGFEFSCAPGSPSTSAPHTVDEPSEQPISTPEHPAIP